MKKTIESKVADTILQRADIVSIGGVEYQIHPPSLATLILVSELVADMPDVDKNSENVLAEVLRTAKDMKIVGRIAATLILGAKRIKENHKVVVEQEDTKKRFSWFGIKHAPSSNPARVEVSELEHLTEVVLNNTNGSELTKIISDQLINIGVSEVFGLTTSLCEANLLRRTRGVVTTTASGG